jgi:hypothetical protein
MEEIQKFVYNELFNKLNQCEIVIGTGSCQDICATQEKICIFAQAGEKSCLDSSSTKCTCC